MKASWNLCAQRSTVCLSSIDTEHEEELVISCLSRPSPVELGEMMKMEMEDG